MSYIDLEIHPEELRRRIDAGDEIVLLDVRNGWEHETARIEGSRLIPLHTLHARTNELERSSEIVVLCHLGARSLMAAQFLQQSGFNARSLHGGIDLWAQVVDPSVPRY